MRTAAPSRFFTSLLLVSLSLSFSFGARAQESPWLLVPTLSNDPKLGFKAGVMAGYLKQFDPLSNVSMVGGFANYSDTHSYTAGLFSDLYWGGNRHKFRGIVVGGYINNEYDDYLGSGATVDTEDHLKGVFVRYSRRFKPLWYLGVQAASSNYAIGIDGLSDEVAQQVGLTGFDANGVGLALEYDNRDNTRSTTRGHYFMLNNIAYREALGGDDSFDVIQGDYRWFTALGQAHVVGVQVAGRWTEGAPQSGYSSLQLRGYTRGNYLAKQYTHVDMEARIQLQGRWGMTFFAGLACLYESLSDCRAGGDRYAAGGGGVTYLVKPAAGFVIKAEYALGEKDNSAFYLKLGHAF
ncbi:BamA/TamA family outer membrane protein [Motiliproteus sp. SC1-56]|uniref:BamA/TamA family outer membrane protein n=1 Tax=Motiliproteus sp. SC1-56 TaxID=2799565 RepID=UPI001A8EA970|nr:BamA/TamA family outer membrane protein [Motiliproteus sp. SC1-56]